MCSATDGRLGSVRQLKPDDARDPDEALLDSYRVGSSSAATLASVNLGREVHGGDRSLTAFGP